MKTRYLTILIVALIAMSSSAAAFAQTEEKAAPLAAAAVSAPAPAPEAPQAKEIAIYGEVQTVDAAAGQVAIQYYDYDSDSEKTATVMVDKDSKIENAGSLGDIKKGDWADVTYTVKDGNNAAKVITVEKEETPATEQTSPAAGVAAPAEE